ncbi:MAG: HRDC domain-containing protein [Phaeodactylibacter sp.]|nr:HRDC domain-containing protein [Phaeodactylibacter sp.]MCB9302583.1 HRDC domain-containing protein [Lewinellaceae bacterium]
MTPLFIEVDNPFKCSRIWESVIGRALCTAAILYEVVLKSEDNLRKLDEAQRLLFNRLKDWRKEQADKEGIPAYLVATRTANFLVGDKSVM